MKGITKNTLFFAGYNKLRLETKRTQRFKYCLPDFRTVILGVECNIRLFHGWNIAKIFVFGKMGMKVVQPHPYRMRVVCFHETQNQNWGTAILSNNQVPFSIIKSWVA